jgi:PKHD-type hydroxylase
MKGEWGYFNKYVDKITCEKIIRELEPLCTQEGKIGPVGDNINTSVRNTKICFIEYTDSRFTYIFDIFWRTALITNDQFFQFNISRLNFLQFSKYEGDLTSQYKKHKDVFWINGDPVYHRKLSGMLQLSDPNSYEGGEFQIVDYSIESRPPPSDIREQGSILYIPSFVDHQVTPVTKGTRYSIVAWFEGKKWT